MLQATKFSWSKALLLALLMLLILPFVLLCMYAVPNLEDYAESIIPNVWWHLKFLYLSYDGRFFTSFLFAAINPLKQENYFLYQCIPIVLLAGLAGAFYTLIRTFISKTNTLAIIVSALLLSLFLNRNPNVPYSLYYMISTYVYIVPSIFFLLFIAISYKLLQAEGSQFVRVLFSCFSIFAIAGGNELLLLPTLVWLLFLSYLNIATAARKGKELSLFFVSMFCAYFLVFTSPGVQHSLEALSFSGEVQAAITAIGKSVTFTFEYFSIWLYGNYPLYLSSILFIYLIKNESHLITVRLSGTQTILIILFLIASIFFIATPYTWAARESATVSYSQVFIIPYLFFTLFWFFILYLITSRFSMDFLSNKAYVSYALTFALMASFALDKESKIRVAYHDLFSGKAAQYQQEVMANIYKSKKETAVLNAEKEIELCVLKQEPKSLCSGVYFSPKDEGFHLQYKLFYDIDKIKIVACP